MDNPRYGKDLSGCLFGRWAVLGLSHKVGTKNLWLCRCECGNQGKIYQGHLKRGASKSCGCLRKELARERSFIHGRTGSRLWVSYSHMKQRCTNKKVVGYKHYGMRGIKVCSEWQNFAPFMEWALNNGYTDDLTIDRIDNEKGYYPDNCRWVNHSVQNSNKRKHKNNTSGYIGVMKHGEGWRARVDFNGRATNIGTFQTPHKAAIARDAFVVKNGFPHTLNFKTKRA